MADETSTTPPAAQTAPKQESPAAPSADVDKLLKEVAELRKEAADRRVKAKEADEARAAAELAKATADGDWKAVIEAKEKAAEELRQKLAELGSKATKAERLEAVINAEVATLEAAVGERAKSVAHLSPEDRLPILKEFAALAGASKPPAAKPASGSPAGSQVAKQIDFTGLSKEQILERYTPEEINQAAAALAGGPRKHPQHF